MAPVFTLWVPAKKQQCESSPMCTSEQMFESTACNGHGGGRTQAKRQFAISPTTSPHLNVPPLTCLFFGESMQRRKQKKQRKGMGRKMRIVLNSQEGMCVISPHALVCIFFLLSSPFSPPHIDNTKTA